MSSESVCQVARRWVDVGSFHTRLAVRFMIFTAYSGIFWIYPRTMLVALSYTVVEYPLRDRTAPARQLYTKRSESRCALRLRYVDLVVSIEVAVEVCCCFTVFSC
jgi:hypothetical protein